MKKTLIETIEEDIKKQTTDASNMFGVVTGVLFIGVFMLFLYLAPNIAKTILIDYNTSLVQYNNLIKEFEKQHQEEFKYISKKTFKELEDNNSITIKDKLMYEISKHDPNNSTIFTISKLIIKFKVDDKKIEFILKILPYVIGVVLAGFLFTYRLHIVVAKELNMKKIEIISKLEKEKANKALDDE